MNNIMKREQPAKQAATFGSVVDQIFQNNLSRFFDDSFWGANSNFSNGYSVPVNVNETDKTYELELVAPGLRKEDFQLNIASDTLTVSFEHKEERNGEGYLRHEYKKQSFSRSFSLDETIDAANISARYNDGILYITLPKKENAQKVSRTVQIQ